MKILLDTNILLRVSQGDSPQRESAVEALAKLAATGCENCLVPQVLYEYWVVSTRPKAVNGLGMTPAEVERSVGELLRRHLLLYDQAEVFNRWLNLVVRHQVTGKVAHDARLVAAMNVHGIRRLLTFNTADFLRYSDIEAVAPADVLNG